jgi:hypothetical protein
MYLIRKLLWRRLTSNGKVEDYSRLRTDVCLSFWGSLRDAVSIWSPCGVIGKIIDELETKHNKTNFVAFSPQANYIDGAAAACRRVLVQTFAVKGVSRGQRNGSPRRSSRFSRPGPPTFNSNCSSIILTRAEWTPFQTHYFPEILVAPGINPVPLSSARSSDR